MADAGEHARKKARTVSRGGASKHTHQHSAASGGKRSTRRPMHFVGEATVPWMRVPDDMYGPTFDRADATSWQSTGRRKMLSSHAADGAPLPKLGCALCELEPGNTMWPFHYHLGSHEAIYVLTGTGTMRWGYPDSVMVSVSEGDFIAMPPGPECAHQLTNTGKTVLRYLCIDSKSHPDVTVLPDSQKYGVVAAVPPCDGRAHHLHTAFFSVEDAKPFFDGEDDFSKMHFDSGRNPASTENVYVLGGMKEVENEAMASGMVRPPHKHEPYRNFGPKEHRSTRDH
ncbi:RmlC-like cupin domain-containing protein [Pavlovales sp. CCMP2436]|nr:RmlC-like cupin domain-containing protein [Pavlovales sp. CCMP2436]